MRSLPKGHPIFVDDGALREGAIKNFSKKTPPLSKERHLNCQMRPEIAFRK